MAELRALLAPSGVVGLALGAVSLALWTAVALRWFALRADAFAALEASVRRVAPARRPAAVDRAARALAVYAKPIGVLVASAPLLGLLGTVGGMVELFGALHGRAGALQSSVAGGISTALVTTQLGLVIGAPGLVAARLLDRRQVRLQDRLRASGEGAA